MRELPVRLPPTTVERRGGTAREVFFFFVSFAAVFGAALVLFELITS